MRLPLAFTDMMVGCVAEAICNVAEKIKQQNM